MVVASYTEFLHSLGITEQDMLAAKRLVHTVPEYDTSYYIHYSDIEGLGAFAQHHLSNYVGRFKQQDSWYPLGRYINHSEYPNCYVLGTRNDLVVVCTAYAGQELTLDYFAVKQFMEALE